MVLPRLRVPDGVVLAKGLTLRSDHLHQPFAVLSGHYASGTLKAEASFR